MTKFRIYIAGSTQDKNIGVSEYGTEQDRMHYLADRVVYWLKSVPGVFETFRNQKGWNLSQTVSDCNQLACDVFLDLHTNAGPRSADGTETYYCEGSVNGKKLAETIDAFVSPLSPGTDRGVLSDFTLYDSGLFVLRHTKPPAALLEVIYHSNETEVEHFLVYMEDYAKAIAKGLCNYFGIAWPILDCPHCSRDLLLDKLLAAKLISNKGYWLNILKGVEAADPAYIEILMKNMIKQLNL